MSTNANGSDPRDDAMDPVVQLAGRWVVREDAGLSPDERAELVAWLRENARHAAVYAETRQMWRIFDQMPGLTPAAAAGPAGSAGAPGAGPRRRCGGGLSFAIAAALVLGLALWWLWSPTRADGFADVAEVPAGGWRKHALPDGSVVQLNSDSRIEIRYTASERHLLLERGEAHFTVVKDAARPFLVRAGGIDVRAVGTAFNVRLGPGSVDVLVTDGHVRVAAAPAAQPVRSVPPGVLAAGQRVSIPRAVGKTAAPVVATLSPVDTQRALAWMNPRLTFDDTPLSEIVAEFNRYNSHALLLADPRLAKLRFGGTFPADDTANLVRLLERDFGVVVERREEETRLRLP